MATVVINVPCWQTQQWCLQFLGLLKPGKNLSCCKQTPSSHTLTRIYMQFTIWKYLDLIAGCLYGTSQQWYIPKEFRQNWRVIETRNTSELQCLCSEMTGFLPWTGVSSSQVSQFLHSSYEQ